MVQPLEQLEQHLMNTPQDLESQKGNKLYIMVLHQWSPIHPVYCCLVLASVPIVGHNNKESLYTVAIDDILHSYIALYKPCSYRMDFIVCKSSHTSRFFKV